MNHLAGFLFRDLLVGIMLGSQQCGHDVDGGPFGGQQR